MPPSTRQSERGVVLRRVHNRSLRNSLPSEDSDDDDSRYSEDLASLSLSDQSPPIHNNDPSSSSLSSSWELDLPRDRSKIMDEFANRSVTPEETALMIRKFVKAQDVPFSRTYQTGKVVRGSSSSAHTPQIGLVVLPGADLPEVNRLEQNGMISGLPDQRDAIWRVNTAGSLLSNIKVTKELALVTEDVTADVADNAHKRLERAKPGSHYSYRRDAVTINSDNVEVVHDFADSCNELDLSATLIEVNVSSLWSLMHDYKHIISNSGPQMTVQQTKALLDRMIESARRFCVRSPILFRMSTRTRIINSNNTRYGVDNEHSFQTFTTSKGIQEIILMSASYFNSLSPSAPGMDQTTQRVIRPRFLQMLTLLMSLLNDYDLKEMAEFLDRTYGILPERSDMELLFLKVIPLTSINSKVFLQGLIPAVDQWQVPEQALGNYEGVWSNFMKRLARKGYLLPATVEDLGHRKSSWISKWPLEGIQSSTVFARLQYHGAKSRTFNEIPTARFSYEPDLKELTVILTNDDTFTIDPRDYEQISTLTKGLYSMTRCADNTICDLEVSEYILNNTINEAVRVINDAIRKFNFKAGPSPRQKKRGWEIWKAGPGDPVVFQEIESAVRLTRNQATLNGQLLAVAYKLNGRNVPKTEAMRYMSYSYTRVLTLFKHLCDSAGRSISLYEGHIGQVNQLLVSDRKARQMEKDQPFISDAPIAQALGPDDADIPSAKLWYDYQVDVVSIAPGHDELHIQARVDFVSSIHWRSPGRQAEVSLAKNPTKFFVAPLKPVLESQQDDEVRIGDLALLAGRYIVVANPQENDFSKPCVLLNWLEIQDAFSDEVGRRGRNYEKKEDHPVTRFV